jgi:GT2 family glycosyltransferase
VSALDVLIVSHGDGHWLGPCLRSLESHRGDIDTRVVIVENGPHEPDYPAEVTEDPGVLVVRSPNRGFAAGNNLGLRHCGADLVLLLNPDTEIASGTLAAAAAEMDDDPEIGMLAVRQLNPDRTLYPSIRRFPGAVRSLANGFGVERARWLNRRLGERDLDLDRYDRRREIDWTTGAVMLVRREALRSAGDFDERYFLFSEETDLAKRIKDAGWRIVHSPALEVVHYAGKAGVAPKREAQLAYSRLQYARRHFSPAHRVAYRAVLALHHFLRIAALSVRGPTATSSAEASKACLRVLLAGGPPPYRPDASMAQRVEPLVAAANGDTWGVHGQSRQGSVDG